MKKLLLLILLCTALLADFDTVEHFESEFTQSVTSSEGKEIVYKGKIFAKQPFFIVWKYITPVPKEIFIQNNEMVVYEPELEQATYSELKESIDFLNILKQAEKVEEGLYKTRFRETDYFVRVDENNHPKMIFFKDRLENRIDILFDNSVINGDIDPSMFTFIPPEGIDLFRR